MTKVSKARAIGFNHVALEVEDIDAALAFYGQLFDFEIQSKNDNIAFIYMGDQFLNFTKGRRQAPDDERHLGLVVDDKEAVRQKLEELGIEIRATDSTGRVWLPWGNRIEIVGYAGIQFTKAPEVLRAMGLEGLTKTEKALQELAKKGMAPD